MFNFWLLHSLTQSSIRLGRRSQNLFFCNLMFNLKNNENYTVFDEICKFGFNLVLSGMHLCTSTLACRIPHFTPLPYKIYYFRLHFFLSWCQNWLIKRRKFKKFILGESSRIYLYWRIQEKSVSSAVIINFYL